jgi:esterase/lipase
MNKKKNLKRMLWVIGILVFVWLAGDFGYSRYVASKHADWESTIERDSNGVMEGCQAYSLGESDTAVLLVHGINDTPYTYRKLAPELAKDFHVRVMRMPGFGEPLKVCATKTAEDWITVVESEARQLRESHSRVLVVAHSLGGAVTIQSILRAGPDQKELFDGAILLAPAIEVSNRRSPVLPTRIWHNVSAGLLFTKMTYNPFGNDCQDAEERDSANRVQFTPRTMINETFKLIDKNRGQETNINIPILLIVSDKDQVNDHHASEQWLQNLASNRKTIYWNNRSGHALQYDLGWEDVARQIAKFIAADSKLND